MKTNDALLVEMIRQNENDPNKPVKLITDEIVSNPSLIKVVANQVVYLHFFHSLVADFEVQVKTATDQLILTPYNCMEEKNNTILRSPTDIQFDKRKRGDFFIQLLRIQF